MSIGTFVTEASTAPTGSMDDLLKIAEVVGDPVKFKERMTELKSAEQSALAATSVKATVDQAEKMLQDAMVLKEETKREIAQQSMMLQKEHDARTMAIDDRERILGTRSSNLHDSEMAYAEREQKLSVLVRQNEDDARDLASSREAYSELIKQAKDDADEAANLKAQLKSKIEEM